MRCRVAALLFLAMAGCVSSSASPAASPSTISSPTSSAKAIAGGCGYTTTMWRGGEPRWLADLSQGFVASGQPYFIDAFVAGYVPTYPLHAAPAGSKSNKILWVFRYSDGRDLQISGHPYKASSPVVNETLGPATGSVHVYPSFVDVPTAGCWEFDVSTPDLSGRVDLIYL